MTTHSLHRSLHQLSLPICLALALAACGTTQQTRDFRYSGFLKNYAQLEPGGSDEARLIYIDPKADFTAYDSVLIEPITIWRTVGSNIPKLSAQDHQQLANHLHWAIVKQLESDYTIVQRPGKGVLRLRAAITEAKGSSVVMDTISSITPQMRLISGGKKLVTGTHAFVGKAGVEAEILDSLSNRRLMAALDERAGAKTIRGATGAWDDVLETYAYWAERLKLRLEELRKR